MTHGAKPRRLAMGLTLALLSASSVASSQPLVTASTASLFQAQSPRTRFESFRSRLWAPSLPSLAESGALTLRPALQVEVPRHEAAPPSPFVSFRNNFAAQYFRMNPIDGWTWAGLGVCTAGLGLASVFLQLAGSPMPSYLPHIPGVSSSDNPVFLSMGAYSLRYDTLGSLTMNAGVSALSSNLLRLVFAPRNPREERYMRTFATELQGGWLFGVEGAI